MFGTMRRQADRYTLKMCLALLLQIFMAAACNAAKILPQIAETTICNFKDHLLHLPLKKKKKSNLLTGIRLHLHLTKRHPFKSGLDLTETFLFKYSFYHENISYKRCFTYKC